MKNNLIVSVTPFLTTSKLYIVVNEEVTIRSVASDVNILAEEIVTTAYSNDLSKVTLNGPDAYVDEIINLSKEKENLTYSQNNLIFVKL